MFSHYTKLLILLLSGELLVFGKPRNGTSSRGKCTPSSSPSLTRLPAAFSTCSKSVRSSLSQRHSQDNQNMAQLLQSSRYPFRTYDVLTKDGYILTIYRITGSPNYSRRRERKPPVLLYHGLGAASDCWNFQSSSRNLPFKLANAGYDVWLANSRGTTYSLRHQKHSANSPAFWDFSFHELGMHDLPAIIEFILAETNAPRLFYIGHSVGTTAYFVSLSEQPYLNDKIIAGFLMAPTAHVGHMSSPFRTVAHTLEKQGEQAHSEFPKRVRNLQEILQHSKASTNLCETTAVKCGVCDNMMFAMLGYNAVQVDPAAVHTIRAKLTNSVSLKMLSHYSQLVSSCGFQKYDYGIAKNRRLYHRDQPPEYNLKNIKAPTYFFYGEQDNWATPSDVQKTASKLRKSTIKGMHKIKSFFTHSDFILAKDADKLVYNKILAQMSKYK